MTLQGYKKRETRLFFDSIVSFSEAIYLAGRHLGPYDWGIIWDTSIQATILLFSRPYFWCTYLYIAHRSQHFRDLNCAVWYQNLSQDGKTMSLWLCSQFTRMMMFFTLGKLMGVLLFVKSKKIAIFETGRNNIATLLDKVMRRALI